MDPTLLISIVIGIGIVLLLFATRVALRWFVRLVLIGLLLLTILGGAAWWWFNQSKQPGERARPMSQRRASTDRR